MDPGSQINMGALTRQFLLPRPGIKDFEPLPPFRGNTPTNPNTRRPARRRYFHADSLWGLAEAEVQVLTAQATFSIPSKHGTPDAQAKNAERAAVAAVRLKVDPVDIWDVVVINRLGSRRGTLSIGNFLIFFTNETGNAPVRKWQSSEMEGVSFNENNYVTLRFPERIFDFLFKAGSRDEAEAIFRKAIRSRDLARTAPEKFLLHPPPSSERGGFFVVAMYGFKAFGDDELTVKRGEKLTVVDKEGSDRWWRCRNSNGKEGRVPVSSLEARVQIEP
ncbi:cytoskeletal protein binding protein [Tulasnella sp. UAMH 9824]|nr:cytoskeletal protein binding protein [Tulasnella sp. UAMH 9824]